MEYKPPNIVCSCFLLIFIINISNAQVAVIANKSVQAEKISKTELLDFYTGDVKEWEDEQRVYVFDLKIKSETRKNFYAYLGKSSSRMKSIWMKNLLSGNGEPPPALDSEAEMLEKIENTKGAIGFINYEKVNDKVKVLTIIESTEE